MPRSASALPQLSVLLLLLLLIGTDSLPLHNPEAGSASRAGPSSLPAGPQDQGPLISPFTGEVISGAVDPGFAEYVYQQGLLALGEGNRQRAVELLRFYARCGANAVQIARARQLVAEHQPRD